ncbi:MAG TPA: tRNA glutamyl-Q(34) synthetase GluQRS [Alphaproteobacteria bacterium]|jgi:glutamyl-Q tRNA(Asp) synthetase|nr:tRNA glutamyl-Q(34) synthetase GluQRS [Alphaproteobacteria bacterium]
MIVTRFAPSPTGYLHLGHACSALIAERAAREAQGRFLLRIEDIDTGRSRPEFEAAIHEDLAWLGVRWDGAVRRQSEHMDDYRAALDRLEAMGATYPCFCSRKDIFAAQSAPHGAGTVYPGTCRHRSPEDRAQRIAAGQPYAIRLDIAAGLGLTGALSWHDCRVGAVSATPDLEGDPVIARRDTPTSYHLSVTVDDHLQGVTLVTRGEDLFPATHIHRLLQGLLGYATPDYCHYPLLTNTEGVRLSKRDGAVAIRTLRELGKTPEEVMEMATCQLL